MNARQNIPYGRQSISDEDIAAVVEVLRSDWLTQGPAVPAFEKAVADYCGATHAVAVNSATSALHIACLALGVGPGDLVWTSPITFVATANCARYCGADVDFVDVEPDTANLCVIKLAEKLEHAKQAGRLPKLVIPVHFAGLPCDMQAIHALSKQYGFRIIEDASHAIGARYQGEPTGNCRYSDITVFSFHPVKIITSGEGGMALTNDPALAARMELLRSHGVTRDPGLMESVPHGQWYYEQIELGFNYRMTDIHAALGLSQMKHLDDFILHRDEIAGRYNDLLDDLPLQKPGSRRDRHSAHHLYVISVLDDSAGDVHHRLFDGLRSRGIGVNLHYIPVYRQPYYQRLGFEAREFPQAERHYAASISLPMYAGLSPLQQDQVATALHEELQP
jgi:UDP-4-amino-4,6-dideoxy-N-acetyl-beta-L-altrosamine transaminase